MQLIVLHLVTSIVVVAFSHSQPSRKHTFQRKLNEYYAKTIITIIAATIVFSIQIISFVYCGTTEQTPLTRNRAFDSPLSHHQWDILLLAFGERENNNSLSWRKSAVDSFVSERIVGWAEQIIKMVFQSYNIYVSWDSRFTFFFVNVKYENPHNSIWCFKFYSFN